MHVCIVLETLLHHKLYVKASKCQFSSSSIGFLGQIISEHCITVDTRKIATVAEWATQQSCTNVRRFVGLANYYNKFDPRFSARALAALMMVFLLLMLADPYHDSAVFFAFLVCFVLIATGTMT